MMPAIAAKDESSNVNDLNELVASPALLLMVAESHVAAMQARHLARMAARAEDRGTPESVSRLPNAQKTGGYGYAVDSRGVATVQIRGHITPEQYAWYDDDETISEWVIRDLAAMEADETVRAVLFQIDSPGGYVVGTFELADAIQQLSAKKPTATAVGGYCCSAAYLLACMTGHITAFRTAIVGSIGTRSMLIDAREYFAKAGVKIIPIDSGGMKSAGLIGTEITPEQIQYFRAHVMKLQEVFTKAVASGRNMTIERAQSLADGRVHVGADALALGLIDAVGNQAQAYQGLSGGAADPRKPGLSRMTGGASSFNELPAQAAGEAQASSGDGPPAAGAEADTQSGADAPGKGPEMPQANNTAPANPTAGATAASAANGSTELKPATIAELKAAFPSDPAFALESAEKALTLVEAKAAYADVLQQRLTAEQARTAAAQSALAQQQAQAAQQAAQQTGTKRVGVKPVESAAGDAGAAGSTGADPVEAFNAEVQRQMAKPGFGGDRKKAIAAVCRSNPVLHEQYLLATNTGRKQQELIKDRFNA